MILPKNNSVEFSSNTLMTKTLLARRFMSRASVRSTFAGALIAFLTLAVPVLSLPARAQSGAPQANQGYDTSALRPPAGASVAIVEFSDFQCPACAHANPVLAQAAARYKIPWVHHDLLIPGHNWSPLAAVYARWFDAKDPKHGEDFRNQVFANQSSIETLFQLRNFTVQFAQSRGIHLPPDMDPQGKLADAVRADTALGLRTGILQTPTVFVVTTGSRSAPYTRVLDIEHDLDRYIEQALAATSSQTPAPSKKPRGK
jgi:protein-disulfide isomerase